MILRLCSQTLLAIIPGLPVSNYYTHIGHAWCQHFMYSSTDDTGCSLIYDIMFSFSRSLQLGMITEHAPVSKSMSSENNHHKLKPSSAQSVSEPSIDIDSRPPAPLPPEVSAYT